MKVNIFQEFKGFQICDSLWRKSTTLGGMLPLRRTKQWCILLLHHASSSWYSFSGILMAITSHIMQVESSLRCISYELFRAWANIFCIKVGSIFWEGTTASANGEDTPSSSSARKFNDSVDREPPLEAFKPKAHE